MSPEPPSTFPPPDPPAFFVDRSLGRYEIPNALRERGLVVHTMVSVYGKDAEQTLDDVTWIQDAARHGWVVLTADQLRYESSIQTRALMSSGLQVFGLPRGDLPGHVQRARFVDNLDRILEMVREPGPWIAMVYERSVVKRWPKPKP